MMNLTSREKVLPSVSTQAETAVHFRNWMFFAGRTAPFLTAEGLKHSYKDRLHSRGIYFG